MKWLRKPLRGNMKRDRTDDVGEMIIKTIIDENNGSRE